MKPDKNRRVTYLLLAALALTLLLPQILAAYSSSPVGVGRASSNSNAASSTIIVPDDYPTISAAVGNASQGATVLLRKGTYFENPVINKALSIVGEDSKNTIIVGEGGVDRGARPVFAVTADNVKLSGLTIQSLNYPKPALHATGIIVSGDNCTITDNNIEGTYYGIFCSVQSYTTISHNNITGALKDGIRFCGGSMNTISENNIAGSTSSAIAIDGYSNAILRNNIVNNGRGIGTGSSYTVVFGNSITGNLESGLYYGASHCIIAANQIADNKWGIYFTSFFANPNNDNFYHNNFVGNSHDVYIGSPYIVESWDNGYPSGGNYWSSFSGPDAKTGSDQNTPGNDGISDSPFTVSANNTDGYPLTAPLDISAAGSPPSTPSPSTTVPNSAVSLWHCDEVTPCGVTPDAAGSNPAMLEPDSGDNDYHPVLVDGKFGKALRYSGGDYAYVAASSSLEIQGDLTVDVWVNVQEFKNVTYNNIVVECARSFGYPTRVWGLAVNGVQDNSSLPVGVLRGYILDTTGRFNEIATKAPVISLNQWTHVVFTRSLTTGMHLYVNEAEQEVTVTSGTQNPTDPISRGNEFYMGHDSISTIDEVVISNVAVAPGAQVPWLQWWFWTLIFGGLAAFAGATYLLGKSNSKRNISQAKSLQPAD